MQEGADRIQLRLDRAFANSEWARKFNEMRVYHLVDSTSDHSALHLTVSPPQRVLNTKRFTLKPYGQKMGNVRILLNLPGG